MSIAQNFAEISPSLSLDFANVKALDPRVSFARASTGAYYDGISTTKAEENLLLQSQTFDSVSWAQSDVTLTANAITAPDGTSTAYAVIETTANSSHRLRQIRTLSATTHTFSVLAKPNGRDFVNLADASVSNCVAYFNLSTGAVGTVGSSITEATITAAGDGWYRCSITFTAAGGANSISINLAQADNDAVYAGDITKGVYLWGAQLEQRSVVTAYTPTTTQPITNYIPVLQTASANVARFDHNPVTGESLGLLVEEQRTNLVLRSEEFADAPWNKTNSSITADTIVAPDGTLTGDKHIGDNGITLGIGTSDTRFFQSPSLVSGTTYTFSIYAKKGEFDRVILALVANPSVVATVSLVDGSIVSGTGLSVSSVGNGWYRILITFTSGTTGTVQIRLSSLDSTATTGDGYSGIYIWGAQLEAGAFPTSYIPTVASQVTRSADSASMTGANFSDWYRQDEGSFFVDYQLGQKLAGIRTFSVSDDTPNNYIDIIAGPGAPPSTTQGSYLFGIANGVLDINTGAGAITNVANERRLFAGAYKVNDYAVCNNGGTIGSDTSASVPVVDRLYFANGTNSPNSLINGHIRKLSYYPQRLSDVQLQGLTS
jgi:hypothetical protein